MKQQESHSREQTSHVSSKGFAIIASLSILSLTVMVALAMVTLTQSTTRVGSYASAADQAKANARLALSAAISKLQQYSGPDTRITAPADLLVAGAPPVVGVWKSWEGSNNGVKGRPIAPFYGSKKLNSDNEDSRFVGFLVSGAQSLTNPLAPELSSLVYSSPSTNTVPLLSTGSLLKGEREVHLDPIKIETNTGSFAWWISGENQKARISQPFSPQADTNFGWARLNQSYTVPDLDRLGLGSYLADPEAFNATGNKAKPITKLLSRRSLDLLNYSTADSPSLNFYDYSTTSSGLLTNVATGGWRKDLSLLSEQWYDIYGSLNKDSKKFEKRIPLYKYTPEDENSSQVPLPSEAYPTPEQSNFYPWSNYVQLGNSKGKRLVWNYASASASWANLVAYLRSYKSVSLGGSGSESVPEMDLRWRNDITSRLRKDGKHLANNNVYKCYHENHVQAVVARYQLIVQANALRYEYTPGNNRILSPEEADKNYRINLRVVPILTFWNPYNVKLISNTEKDIGFFNGRSLPVVMSVINGTFPPENEHEGNFRYINQGNSSGIDGFTVDAANKNLYDRNWPANIGDGLPEYINGSWFGVGVRSFTSWLPRDIVLKPGEVKVYTPGFNVRAVTATQGIRLKEGYALGDDKGMAMYNLEGLDLQSWLPQLERGVVPSRRDTMRAREMIKEDFTRILSKDETLRFAIRSDRETRFYTENFTDKTGSGDYFVIGSSAYPELSESQEVASNYESGGVPKGVQNYRGIFAIAADSEWGEQYWPNDDLQEVQYKVSEITPGDGNPDWTNLFSISFGPKFTFGAGYNNIHNRPTKGFVQSNPLVKNTFALPLKEQSFHPANGAYECSYQSMSLNSPLAPEIGTKGYIISGFQAGEGISRMIAADIPLMPLASLAELQNWDLRGLNPLPPHQFNLIGNSDATPMIPKDSVVIESPASIGPNTPPPSVETILQHDDAYCANQLLFDDWFFSTVNPKQVSFGEEVEKDLNPFYKDFLMGKENLQNRAYLPIEEDRFLSETEANKRASEMLENADRDGWRKIASRLEVEGMFNVNSTSIKAWRALLGHSKKRSLTIFNDEEIVLDTQSYDHVLSRGPISYDEKAGENSGQGAFFDYGSQFSGFREFSEEQLDELAEEIVEQVRLRGPFLSLSEFINRQLSQTDNLAIAGALQCALNNLSNDPNETLKDSTVELSEETMSLDDPKLEGVDYAFKEASKGHSTHGIPGWIRQADILRPIAPILSARDDSFTIRAYGDARDKNGKIIAQAWCEAVVKRTRSFVDQSDAADSTNAPISKINQKLGRRYKVLSFRWLTPQEV